MPGEQPRCRPAGERERPGVERGVRGIEPAALGEVAQPAAAGARMRELWLTFATTGTLPDSWPPYTRDERRTLIIDDEDRVEADPRGDRREVWERFLPEL